MIMSVGVDKPLTIKSEAVNSSDVQTFSAGSCFSTAADGYDVLVKKASRLYMLCANRSREQHTTTYADIRQSYPPVTFKNVH